MHPFYQISHRHFPLARAQKIARVAIFGIDTAASAEEAVRTLLRGGADDEQVTSAIASIWRQRGDRYSELRSVESASQPPGTRRVEMHYIGG